MPAPTTSPGLQGARTNEKERGKERDRAPTGLLDPTVLGQWVVLRHPPLPTPLSPGEPRTAHHASLLRWRQSASVQAARRTAMPSVGWRQAAGCACGRGTLTQSRGHTPRRVPAGRCSACALCPPGSRSCEPQTCSKHARRQRSRRHGSGRGVLRITHGRAEGGRSRAPRQNGSSLCRCMAAGCGEAGRRTCDALNPGAKAAAASGSLPSLPRVPALLEAAVGKADGQGPAARLLHCHFEIEEQLLARNWVVGLHGMQQSRRAAEGRVEATPPRWCRPAYAIHQVGAMRPGGSQRAASQRRQVSAAVASHLNGSDIVVMLGWAVITHSQLVLANLERWVGSRRALIWRGGAGGGGTGQQQGRVRPLRDRHRLCKER